MDILLAHGTDAEVRTRDQLQALLAAHDLQPWMFTNTAIIDETAIPHSYPVLTLHTRHLDDDLVLLSTFLHEQLHWFISGQPDERVQPTIDTLLARYPCPPVGFPLRAEDALSTYFHHVICYLEYLSLRHCIGESDAQSVMSFWQADHYREIYRTVMEDADFIAALLRQHQLIPRPLDSAAGAGSE